MHYYQFHIGDYASHTRHLSLMEDLAYRRLLDFYYLHEGPIKQREIARQIGMREHEQDVLTVLNEFFISTEHGFVNPRADKEIESFRLMAEAGKRGAAKRWAKGGDSPPIGVPNDTPIATINHKPITNIKAPSVAPVAKPESVSEEVWQEFVAHRKRKKGAISALVLKNLEKQANIAGWTLDQAMAEMVSRNWQGFDASWVTAKTPTAKPASSSDREKNWLFRKSV